MTSRILAQCFLIRKMNVICVWCLLKGTQLWWRVWPECQGTCTRSGPAQLQWTPTTNRLCILPTHSRVTTKLTCHNGTACVLIGYIYKFISYTHSPCSMLLPLEYKKLQRKKIVCFRNSRNLECILYTSCWIHGYFETFDIVLEYMKSNYDIIHWLCR